MSSVSELPPHWSNRHKMDFSEEFVFLKDTGGGAEEETFLTALLFAILLASVTFSVFFLVFFGGGA